MSLVRLKDIANVQLGYPFRSRLEQANEGNVLIIQLRNISEDGLFSPVDITRIHMSGVEEHHLVQPEDIVFRSRGQTNKAAMVDKALGKSVVAGPLLRIRVTNDKILPAYLTWYINQSAAQTYLARHSKGTAARMISKRAVKDMEIPVPSREVQQKIVELADLSSREQQLIQALAGKRKQYMEHMMMGIALNKKEIKK